MDISSLIPAIVGLGVGIGTSIPGLRKPKRTKAGQRAATEAAHKVASTAVGASQTGFGASRGLALREGLRAASEQARGAATAQGAAAAADEAAYQEQLAARNERLASFGGNLAKGLGDMAAGLIKPKAAETTEVQQKAEGALQAQPEMKANETGLEGPSAGVTPQQQALTQEITQIPGFSNIETLDTLEQEAADAATGPTAAFQVDPVTQILQARPPSLMPDIERQLADRLHMKELLLAEGYRQGLGMEQIIARANRRLQLQPGQNLANPFGAKLDLGSE